MLTDEEIVDALITNLGEWNWHEVGKYSLTEEEGMALSRYLTKLKMLRRKLEDSGTAGD
jgi:hypothetical protein